MEIRRLIGTLKAKWPIIIMMGMMGFMMTVMLTPEPGPAAPIDFQAGAPLNFVQGRNETATQFEARYSAATTLAQQIPGQFESPQGIRKAVNNVGNREEDRAINFVAIGTDRDQVSTVAQGMRTAFLDLATNSASTDREAEIEEMRAEIIAITERQAELEELTPAEIRSAAESENVQRRLSSLEQIALELERELLVGPQGPNDPIRPDEEIQAEIDDVQNRIVELELQLADLAPKADAEEVLELDLLDSRYQTLVRELRVLVTDASSEGVSIAAGAVSAPPSVTSPEEAGVPEIPTYLGGLAGLLIGLIVVVATDAIRKPIWAGAQLSTRVLAEVPIGSTRLKTDWYNRADGGRRKDGVRMLRTTAAPLLGVSGAAVGLFGIGLRRKASEQTAFDLAASIGTLGRQVLVVSAELDSDDGVFGRWLSLWRSERRQNESGTLSELLTADWADDRQRIHDYLVDRPNVADNVKAIDAGRPLPGAADAISDGHFDLVMREARTAFDVVIVWASAGHRPVAAALGEHVDGVILMAGAGVPSQTQTEELITCFRKVGSTVTGIGVIDSSRSLTIADTIRNTRWGAALFGLFNRLAGLIPGALIRRLGRRRSEKTVSASQQHTVAQEPVTDEAATQAETAEASGQLVLAADAAVDEAPPALRPKPDPKPRAKPKPKVNIAKRQKARPLELIDDRPQPTADPLEQDHAADHVDASPLPASEDDPTDESVVASVDTDDGEVTDTSSETNLPSWWKVVGS